MRSRPFVFLTVIGLAGLVWAASRLGRDPTTTPWASGGSGLIATHLATCPVCSADGSDGRAPSPIACPVLRQTANNRLGWRLRADSLRVDTRSTAGLRRVTDSGGH